MASYEKTLEWIDLPQGRIRYAGGRRGRDESPMQTFAEEVRGRTYYGEIRKSFLPDRHTYNLEVVSFGWTNHDWLGAEPDPRYCAAFSSIELLEVQQLILQAVPAWLALEDRPSVLTEYVDSRFAGEIVFRDGWALVKDDEGIA
ncbi:hypothetical protein [Luteibacter sp. 3190]|uniref:hypothetical protein n=1 Tax=Luteibacter sp. 3190 TaxID=2817736 RepID=UPI0028636F5C|nr:hypothetical protein [Luteibacter sp. 3190]MDR6936296.1 hypothetical protein [Luteibacter sp. 3190]